MTETLVKTLPEQPTIDPLEVTSSKPNYTLRRAGAIGALSLAGLGVYESVKPVVEHTVARIVTPITYSEEKSTYSVKQNEGLDAAISSIPGIESVDFELVKEHVRTMPENIDVFEDKIVSLGETFIIPAEVRKS